MSNIGGFISAPIKLAAIINNRRNEMVTPQADEGLELGDWNCRHQRDRSSGPSKQHQQLQQNKLHRSTTTGKTTTSSYTNKLASRYNRNRPIPSFHLCSSSLAPSLLLVILMINLNGGGQAAGQLASLSSSSSSWRQPQQQQNNNNANEGAHNLLRHQTHYMNIIPSTHFQYNEGRQSTNGEPMQPAPSQHVQQPEVHDNELTLQKANGKSYHHHHHHHHQHSNSHIYKRSSALISSPGGGGGAPLYLPLVSSMPHHHYQDGGGGGGGSMMMNPLRRRMMSAGAEGAGSQSGRWSQFYGQHNSEEQQVAGELLAASASSNIDQLGAAAAVALIEPEMLMPAGSRQHPSSTSTISTPTQTQTRRPQSRATSHTGHSRRPEHEEAELLRQKQHIQYHDQWPSVAGKCHKRTLNFCASVLPFNTTTFPNIIGDTNRFEVKRSLPFFGFLAKSSCNKRLDELLCLLLEPPCGAQSGAAIPPCKKFCRLALEGCNEYIPATLAMSSVFDCRQYPDSNDPSVCINLAQGSKCAHDEFKCPDKTCIPRNWLCDGVRDCIFAADEANCTGIGLQASVCSTEEFKCDGKCVPKAWKCDGERDCLDGSDEADCDQRPRCGPDRFRCADGNGCLPKRWVCDGKAECRDGSDEMNCEQRECSDNDFKCNNGICIPKLWRCDRQFDCKDGSDERFCIYPQSTTTSTSTTTTTTTTTQPPTTTQAAPTTTTTINQRQLQYQLPSQPQLQNQATVEEDTSSGVGNNFYLNATYSVSGSNETPPDRQTMNHQVADGGDSGTSESPSSIVQSTLVGQQQHQSSIDLNPMNYYSGEQHQSGGGSGSSSSSSRDQLESSVSDDVSRIIKQESSSSPQPSHSPTPSASSPSPSSSPPSDPSGPSSPSPAPADDDQVATSGGQPASISGSSSGGQTRAATEASAAAAFAMKASSSKELNKFDYDIIQSSSSPTNLIQLADLMVSGEMASKQLKQQVSTQIDFGSQQQPASARQVQPPPSSLSHNQQQQQQQQMIFGPQQRQQQQQSAPGGRTFAPSAPPMGPAEQQQPVAAAAERLPIYRSLFKTLKHGQGRLAAASAANQHRMQQAGSSRRRRDRHHQSAAVAPAPISGAASAEDPLGSRFPHWSSPAPSSNSDHQQQQSSLPATNLNHHHSPANNMMVANQTRPAHGVASYLQLLNSRYNLRLPRVSPLPPTRAQ